MIVYHKIRLNEKSTIKLEHKTKYVSKELIVVPFGLTNALGFFMSTKSKKFVSLVDKYI